MPNNLIAAFQSLPRHVRLTIFSTIASLILLWAVLTIVVGGINHHLATRGDFLYDALYAPYDLQSRAVPELPEAQVDAVFLVLPEVIANQYTLQIPLSSEEAEAAAQAQREAFLAVSAPAQRSLETLQSTLAELIATSAAAEAPTATEAAAASEDQLSESSGTVGNAFVNAVQAQATAVNLALAQLLPANASVAETESMDQVFARLQRLQDALAGLSAANVDSAELASLSKHLETLAAIEAPVVYRLNECLMASQVVAEGDNATALPCAIVNTASFVEGGSYSHEGVTYNVALAEFDSHDMATDTVSSLYQYGRSIGRTGNFSLGVIEYDYFFHYADDLYSFTWSHENWVYSVSGPTFAEIDALLKVFVY